MPARAAIDDIARVHQRADDDPFAPAAAAQFALANGLVGIIGSIEECADAPDVILPGAHVRRPIRYHERFTGFAEATDTRLLCPSPVALDILIDDVPVDFASARVVKFARYLDLDSGRLHRTTRWQLVDGRTIEIVAMRLVPWDDEALIAARLRLMAVDFSGTVTLVPRFGLARASLAGADDPRIAARVSAQWERIAGPAGTDRFTADGVTVTYRSTVTTTIGRDHAGTIVAPLRPSDSVAFDRVVAVALGHGNDLCAPLPNFNMLAQQQQQAVTRFWTRATCRVADDDRLTQTLRYNLFQVMQSASRDDGRGTAAKGLTGDGYEGHVFWDAEAFMLPALLAFAPDRARAMLQFRIDTLEAARRNARLLGHRRGALYPWRTITGTECSAHYPTGAAQYHINADIALALAAYDDATGDRGLVMAAAPMLFETARVWMDIGRFVPERGDAFCLFGVTGPDEYSALVDNDFYTNAAAKGHLAYAVAVAHQLRADNPDAASRLFEALTLDDDEIARWAQAAAAMWLPVDPATGVRPQDDGFLLKPRFPGAIRRAGRPLLLDHHPMTLFRHRVAKQGDVIQAIAMGLIDGPVTQDARDFAYYEPLTTHDSTLSAPAFGIVAARLGRDADARHFLDDAAFVDIENRHGNTDHGLHMAALAGSWLVLARGWAGMRPRADGLRLAPRTAPELGAYTLRFGWRDSVVELAVDGAGATYRLIDGPPLTLADHGRPVAVGTAPVSLPHPRLRAVIFDLDGVLTDTAEDHYAAWADLARRHGLRFDRAFNERLKGVDRLGSLKLILEHSGIAPSPETVAQWAAEKNDIYRARLRRYTPEHLFPGVSALFAGLRDAGMMIGLASASRNAREVVARLGLGGAFDVIADADAAAPKPAPDIFVACATQLGIDPAQCVGVEDAQAGIDAIRTAGMKAIAIAPDHPLTGADMTVDHIARLSVGDIVTLAEGPGVARPIRSGRMINEHA